MLPPISIYIFDFLSHIHILPSVFYTSSCRVSAGSRAHEWTEVLERKMNQEMRFPVAAQIKEPSSSSQAGKYIITLTTRDLPYSVIGLFLGDQNMNTHRTHVLPLGCSHICCRVSPPWKPKVQAVVWMKSPLFTLERDGQSDYVSEKVLYVSGARGRQTHTNASQQTIYQPTTSVFQLRLTHLSL